MSHKGLRTMLKAVAPHGVRRVLRQTQKSMVYSFRCQHIRWPVAKGRPIKIIVGAAMTKLQQPLDQESGVVMRSRSNVKTMSERAGWA